MSNSTTTQRVQIRRSITERSSLKKPDYVATCLEVSWTKTYKDVLEFREAVEREIKRGEMAGNKSDIP